jgi:hypothetical protein
MRKKRRVCAGGNYPKEMAQTTLGWAVKLPCTLLCCLEAVGWNLSVLRLAALRAGIAVYISTWRVRIEKGVKVTGGQ